MLLRTTKDSNDHKEQISMKTVHHVSTSTRPTCATKLTVVSVIVIGVI